MFCGCSERRCGRWYVCRSFVMWIPESSEACRVCMFQCSMCCGAYAGQGWQDMTVDKAVVDY